LSSLAKPKESIGHIIALTDFAMLQSMQQVELGSRIWDELVKIKNGNYGIAR